MFRRPLEPAALPNVEDRSDFTFPITAAFIRRNREAVSDGLEIEQRERGPLGESPP
jgi:hypothetical protein